MNIRVLQLLEGARRATGLTVVIDVFRAFSVECYLYGLGAGAVLPVGSLETARALGDELQNAVLVGERGGRRCEGFDFGNSPSQLAGAELTGKTVVHTTSAGTQGVASARHAEEIVGAGLVNARATASYILRRRPSDVSLVCMGNGGVTEAEEDLICAEYLKCLLEGRAYPLAEKLRALRTGGGAHFFDPALQDVFPQRDFTLCTAADRFPFALRIERDPRRQDVFHSIAVPQ